MKRPLMPYESFLAGIKPTCYENISRLNSDILRKLERFPRFSLCSGHAVFFRDEESRDAFVHAVRDLPRDSAHFNRLLGETLGYPPLAVDFFAKKVSGEISRDEFTARKTGIQHVGIQCIGDTRDIVDNIKWLWSRYPYDEVSRIVTYRNDDRQVYPIPYGDESKLHNVAQELNKKLHKAPAATV